MPGEVSFFEFLADSSSFEHAVAKSKEKFREFIGEFGKGAERVERDSQEMAAAVLKVEAAEAKLAATIKRTGEESLASRRARLGGQRVEERPP